MTDDSLQDHSDKSGMRIYVELKREAIPQVALNKLFKHTSLQTTFGYNAVALVDGVPRTLSLLELIRHYLDFQREVVTRRSKYELRKAEERAHVLARLPDRARQPRRGDRADPRRRRHRCRARRADEEVRAQRDPGAGDPRPPPRARSPGSRARRSRPSTPTSQERIGELRLAARRRGAHRRRDQGGAARDQGDLRQERRPPHRDRRRRGRARARGHDRGGGHGDRDHALRLHQAAARSPPIASSGAAASA